MLRVKRIAGSWVVGTRLQRAHLDFHLGMNGSSEKADENETALPHTPLDRRDPIPEFYVPGNTCEEEINR